jgi:hypothetical protein
MRTLTQQPEAVRRPMVARWELVTDAHGRTRPEMRWERDTQTSSTPSDHSVALAA